MRYMPPLKINVELVRLDADYLVNVAHIPDVMVNFLARFIDPLGENNIAPEIAHVGAIVLRLASLLADARAITPERS